MDKNIEVLLNLHQDICDVVDWHEGLGFVDLTEKLDYIKLKNEKIGEILAELLQG